MKKCSIVHIILLTLVFFPALCDAQLVKGNFDKLKRGNFNPGY